MYAATGIVFLCRSPSCAIAKGRLSVNKGEREKRWARVHVGHMQSKDRIAPEAMWCENYHNISLKVNTTVKVCLFLKIFANKSA
jgi:hypothetical protein